MSRNTQFETVPEDLPKDLSEDLPRDLPRNSFEKRPGRLVVFEGVEGSGKTTQIKAVHTWLVETHWLNNRQESPLFSQCVATREPGGTGLGQQLRQLLLHPASDEPLQDRTELLLYAADRAQHVEGMLKPLLAQGALILCDRYTDSTIAYQGYGRQLDRPLIDQLNQIATSGLQSDLTLWLDLDVELGLARAQQRGSHDRIEQATIEFHHRVQQGFTDLAKTFPDRIIRIDASQPSEQVTQQIQTVLIDRLGKWAKE
ncbi:dTMP kinase [Leptolyngbya sp. FACHB-711]|uniref:dTMP kinase n=1 Tax=unclassified Leptolyngbya TaxID=2650499 RepID=UPI00168249AE|nr:dTMP kinase [Leptolyngbya sp. FACHB-711]MBD1851206.1 dTMP kinase [Cyanobacteria bacterium FACHB-502]MBD2023967.1 dTMP kinase [Leptolyngbya sp. FACHB-711]